MNPIISPLWFYLIGVTSGLIDFLLVVGSVLLVGSAIVALVYAMEEGYDVEDKKQMSFWKKLKM